MEETRLTIRLPKGVADMMAELAKQHNRSQNGEIVQALQDYLHANLTTNKARALYGYAPLPGLDDE